MLSDILINFFHSAPLVFGLLIILWTISLTVKDASLIDIFWGFGFLVVGAVCLYLANPKTPYLYLLGSLPMLWGARLTLYLARRNLGHGEDTRYIAMRLRAEKKGLSETAWRIRTLFTVYFGQFLLIMIVSAPVWIAMASANPDLTQKPTAIGPLAVIGAVLWLIGFLFEAIGDAQLAAFKKQYADYSGAYEDKPVLDTGLWKYTRHPNYFGNACLWWGIWLVACQAPWGWVSVFAPLIMTVLLTRISGRDLLERQLKKRPAYQDYITRTSGFFPWPPKR